MVSVKGAPNIASTEAFCCLAVCTRLAKTLMKDRQSDPRVWVWTASATRLWKSANRFEPSMPCFSFQWWAYSDFTLLSFSAFHQLAV